MTLKVRVCFLCLFVCFRISVCSFWIRKTSMQCMSAYSVSSGNRAKNGETIVWGVRHGNFKTEKSSFTPGPQPLFPFAVHVFCSSTQLAVSPCLICLFVFSYRKHTVKALGSFAFMAGDWQVSCHVIYRCWLFWLSFLVENKVPCELIIGWRFNNLDRNCHSILANILSTIVLGIFLIYL